MYKYVVCMLVALAPLPVFASNLYVDFAYDGAAVSFELYQDAILLCTEPDPSSRQIVCPVVDEVGATSHVYHIVAKTVSTDVVGETATYTRDIVAPTVTSSMLIDAAGKKGRRMFYRDTGTEIVPYAPVAGSGGNFATRVQ